MSNSIKPQYIDLGIQTGGIRVCGIRFFEAGEFQKAMFWFKNNDRIKYVTVVLDAKFENITVQNETAILSLKGLKGYAELKIAIMLFLSVMQSNNFNNIQFKFICENNQKAFVTSIAKELNLNYTIQEVNPQVELSANKELNSNLTVINANEVPVMKVYVEDNLILDLNNEPIGIIGQGFSQEGNIIYRNGRPFATVIRSEEIQQENSVSNGPKTGKIRILGSNINYIPTGDQVRGPISGTGPTKSAAFVNLPIIMFILSALLLIGSIILLFVLD